VGLHLGPDHVAKAGAAVRPSAAASGSVDHGASGGGVGHPVEGNRKPRFGCRVDTSGLGFGFGLRRWGSEKGGPLFRGG
jgi:hypothetical protein